MFKFSSRVSKSIDGVDQAAEKKKGKRARRSKRDA